MGKPFLSAIIFIILLSLQAFMGVIGVSARSIKDARKHAEETLLPLEGITGISHREDPPKIIVYIEHEKYKGKVPSQIDGFNVEVVVTGKIKALSMLQLELLKPKYSEAVDRTGIVRPIVGGISIGIPETAFGGKMAGTLGVIVKVGDQAYMLTNAHVIAMDSKARFLPLGTAVLQPGAYDGGTTVDKVGELYKYIKITFGPKGRNYADAAIAKITITEYLDGRALDSTNQDTYKISGTIEVSTEDIVRKSGRTTGVTCNMVFDTDATVKVWYTASKWAIFYDQILVSQPFIQAGDSGSAVDKSGAFVGLAFAGSTSVAVVCKAKYITSGLGITI